MSTGSVASGRWSCLRVLLGIGLLTTAAQAQFESAKFTGSTLRGEYGRAVANAGDVNGDGIDDYLISAPSEGTFAEGQVQVVSGATASVIRTHIGGAANDQFGQAVSGLGDIDLDGVPDYAIGIPFKNVGLQDTGRVTAFSGASGQRLWNVDGTRRYEGFGEQVVGLDDSDGDGRTELLVLSESLGEATVVSGLGVKLRVLNTLGHPITSIGRAGDLDGDGIDEVLVGSHRYSGTYSREGLVLVFSGATGAQINSFTGNQDDVAIGWRTLGINDVDGDGVRDLLVSGRIHVGLPVTSDGQVEVRSGATLAVISTFFGTREQFLGESLAVAGDWNLDGVADWIIGAPNGGYFGTLQVRSGADSSLLREIAGEWHDGIDVHSHGFGEAVAGGDWNGDGIGDVVAGASDWHDADFEYEGAVFVYLGCPAFSQAYGTGWPGTLGTPAIAATGPPIVGQAITITASNSLGATTSGALLVGLDDDQFVLPSGATVLVDDPLIVPVSIPATGFSETKTLPDDPAFYFLDLFLQVVEFDAGAIGGISLTQGLQLRCGFDL